jgi:hypothetical protein
MLPSDFPFIGETRGLTSSRKKAEQQEAREAIKASRDQGYELGKPEGPAGKVET